MIDDPEPADYRAKIHNSLTEKVMMAGTPRKFFILNFAINLGICWNLHQPEIGLPLGLGLYFFVLWVVKTDPYMFEIVTDYMRLPPFLDV